MGLRQTADTVCPYYIGLVRELQEVHAAKRWPDRGAAPKDVTAKEILMTTSTQALYSLSWVRYELLISNRLTVCEQMSP